MTDTPRDHAERVLRACLLNDEYTAANVVEVLLSTGYLANPEETARLHTTLHRVATFAIVMGGSSSELVREHGNQLLAFLDGDTND